MKTFCCTYCPIENSKQKTTTGNSFQMVENRDIVLEILQQHNPFERIRGHDNCDVRVFDQAPPGGAWSLL